MSTQKIKLEFPLDHIGVPVFSQLASTFDVEPNVLAADITPHKGGWMLLNVSGSDDKLSSALTWIKQNGVTVTTID